MRTSRKVIMGVSMGLGGVATFAAFVMTSGSSSVEVHGEIEAPEVAADQSCRINLMSLSSAPWTDDRKWYVEPHPQEIPVGDCFEAIFILHGPSDREHWLEIRCPGYEAYKTDVFLAPSEHSGNIDLGTVRPRKTETPESIVLAKQKKARQEAEAKNGRIVEAAQVEAQQEKAEKEVLTSWLKAHIDEVSGELGRYYCFDPAQMSGEEPKPGSLNVTAIVTDREAVKSVDGERDGKPFSDNEYQIQLTVVWPKEHHGKRINLSAWRKYPGPEPSWIGGTEVGNLVSLSFDKNRIKNKEWSEPLELSLSSVSVSSHRALCVWPDGGV